MAACTLLSETNKLVEGNALTGSGDGGSGQPVAPDAATFTGDGAVPGDGATLLGDGGSSDGGCGAWFCDSFDEGTLGARWELVQSGAGPLTLDTAASLSAPRSLLASVVGGPPYRSSFLGKKVPAFSHVWIEVQIRVDARDPADVTAVSISPKAACCAEYVADFVFYTSANPRLNGFIRVVDGGTPTYLSSVAPAYNFASWRLVRVDMWNTGRAVLSVDSSEAAIVQLPPTTFSEGQVRIGAPYTTGVASTSGWKVRHDDVRIGYE